MIIKNPIEKIKQIKEEVIKLREFLDENPATPIIKVTISSLYNIENLLFDNNDFKPTK